MSITRGLEVVASTDERPGFVVFGVNYDGAFHPIALQKLGHHESFKGSQTSLRLQEAVDVANADAPPAES